MDIGVGTCYVAIATEKQIRKDEIKFCMTKYESEQFSNSIFTIGDIKYPSSSPYLFLLNHEM